MKYKVIASIASAPVLTLLVVGITMGWVNVRKEHQKRKELVNEVWQTIDRKYIDSKFNRQNWKVVGQKYLNSSYSSQEEAYKAIQEMLNLLRDPYTTFTPPPKAPNMMQNNSNRSWGAYMLYSDFLIVVETY